MIGKRIPQLPTADTITGDELLVVEQNGRTKSTTASTLVSGTSGIANITDFGARTTKADNYSSIQAAINSGAKQLNWPAGTFNVATGLTPASNQIWVGVPGATILRLSNSAPTNQNLVGLNQTGTQGSLDNFTARGIIFDGNGKDAAFVVFGCNGLYFEDCVFQNGGTYGLALQARPGYVISLPQTDVSLINCQFNNNGSDDPPGFDGLDIKWVVNCTLVGCSADANTDVGINIRGRNVNIIGCTATNNRTAGFLLQSNDATENSYFNLAGGFASGTLAGPGLEIQGASGNNTYVEVSNFQSWSNTGDGVRISGSGKVIGTITSLQSRLNTLSGFRVLGDYVTHMILSDSLLLSNLGDGVTNAGSNLTVTNTKILANTGNGYIETGAVTNNYLMPSCSISGNGVANVGARVGTEVDLGFQAVRTDDTQRLFPGHSAGLELRKDAAGASAGVASVGTGTNVNLQLTSKGNGDIEFFNQNGTNRLFTLREAGTLIVNYPELIASLTNTPVILQASGTDANIDLRLSAKGTGRLQTGYGVTAATTPANFTATHILEFKDNTGTIYRLPCRTAAW